MRLLVTGGAGFVGSVTVDLLLRLGHEVTVVDNLRTGFRENVPEGAKFHCVDLGDGPSLDSVFASAKPEAVLHFAASCIIPESIRSPLLYWEQNFNRTQDLVSLMRKHDCMRIVFSSSVAVYGTPRELPMTEMHPLEPANPYGFSKMCAESFLRSLAPSGLSSISLRFFNAVGCSPNARHGQFSTPETRIIPRAIHAALGLVPPLTIFGQDWSTTDGTCVRDFVHVQDLASAHVHALEMLERDPGARAFNLGNGRAYSILEVIASVERVVGRAVPHDFGERREGDVGTMVASAELANRELGWHPENTELDEMVASAWRWHQMGWADLNDRYGSGAT